MFRAGWNHHHVALFQARPLIAYFASEFAFQHQQNLIAFLVRLAERNDAIGITS
jgi:hypothetical protein